MTLDTGNRDGRRVCRTVYRVYTLYTGMVYSM
jgi:hypothetical protein